METPEQARKRRERHPRTTLRETLARIIRPQPTTTNGR